jgi:hypothetical protein
MNDIIMLKTTNAGGNNNFYWYLKGKRQNTIFAVPAGKILVITDIIGDIVFTQNVGGRYFAISFQGPEGNEAAIIAKRWPMTSSQETLSLNEHYNTGVIIPAQSKMTWSVLGTETGYVAVSILGVSTDKSG